MSHVLRLATPRTLNLGRGQSYGEKKIASVQDAIYSNLTYKQLQARPTSQNVSASFALSTDCSAHAEARSGSVVAHMGNSVVQMWMLMVCRLCWLEGAVCSYSQA